MTEQENKLPKEDSTKSSDEQQESTNLTTRESLIQRLRKGPDARTRFVDSQINKTLAFQIRALRGALSQEKVMEKLGMNQNAISRLENPYYGKATLTTLKRIASAYDVGLLVEFVPYSRLVDRASGTPHTDNGLNPGTMNVPNFEEETIQGAIEERPDASSITYEFLHADQVPIGTGNLLPNLLTQSIEPSAETSTVLNLIAPSASGAINTNAPIASTVSYENYPSVLPRCHSVVKRKAAPKPKWLSHAGRRLNGRRNRYA